MGSRFLNSLYSNMCPYIPGEQPKDRQYIRLNTNESPYPPPPAALTAMAEAAERPLNRYNDPDCTAITAALAAYHQVSPEMVFVGNGADEVLQYALLAFVGPGTPACCPDITYAYYEGYFQSFALPHRIIPLRDDFSLDVEAFAQAREQVVLPNPNAPTGLCVPPEQIERILAADPERLLLLDEAYVDYGGQTCLPLLERYSNLLIVRTFSKSRNLAGGRLGYAVAPPELIRDMNALKAVLNPFNLSTMAQQLGLAVLAEEDYFRRCLDQIITAREQFSRELTDLGFTVLPSCGNFVFVFHPRLPGAELYRRLKQDGVLTRYYAKPRIDAWLRISIGTAEEMSLTAELIRRLVAELG